MFQNVNLQKLDIRKDTNWNFKVLVIEKLWKYKIEPGPLVSRNGRLTGQSRARDTLRGDAVVTICR
jgi:hypothetical protein